MKKPFYKVLYLQVLFAIIVGVLLGIFDPSLATAMKPLGDGFVKLIKMIIAPVIFCTVVAGIAGMQDIKKVGRVGGKALIYFEIVSTFALAIGLIVANVIKPGAGFNVNAATIDTASIAQYTAKTHSLSTIDFLMNIIPNTFVDAFAKGEILQVLFVAILFGFALSLMGERGRPITRGIEALSHAIFGVVNIIMKAAPIGAFGAMAFTIGKYGVKALIPLASLVGSFYLTSALFIVIVLGTSSSESALPALMRKLEKLGCPKSVVGLVVPTGYSFNLDGTNIYMTMAALFVAQATNTELTLTQQLTVLLVAMLTSKGASGITGAGFITLAATLAAVPTIPVAGMVLILGIDKFMSECRALTNIIGNGVAAIVVSKWEGELDKDRMHAELKNPSADDGTLRQQVAHETA